MRNHLSILSVLPVVAALCTSCMVKPPSTGSDLGPPATPDQINAALTQAESGVPQEQAYHVGDYGSMQVIDNVVQSNYVTETHELQVQDSDTGYIYYTDHVVETGSTKEYAIVRHASASNAKKGKSAEVNKNNLKFYTAQKISKIPSMRSRIQIFATALLHSMPLFPNRSFEAISSKLSISSAQLLRFINGIEVAPSKAISSEQNYSGDMKTLSKPNALTTIDITRVMTNILNSRLEARVNNSIKMQASPVPSAAPFTSPSTTPSVSPIPSPVLSPSPTPTPSPSPTAANSPQPTSTSQYYGLTVTKHRYTTSNCSQIPGCAVDATRVQFIEMRQFASGNVSQMNWTYEISTQVPGLFTLLDECYSTVVTQNNNQLPLTECAHVGTFKFGSTPLAALP